MKAAAIIAAAGIGKRMGGSVPKQYLELAGRPVICHTLDRFLDAQIFNEFIIVVEPGREVSFRKDIVEAFGYPEGWQVVAGGEVRQESVYNGLKYLSGDCNVVLVHDGVRPFVRKSEIRKVAEVAFERGACIMAFRIKETVKRVDSEGIILNTVDRSNLWRADTPQGFRVDILAKAFEMARRDSFVGTDEAMLVERCGGKVAVFEGDGSNIKITTPADLKMAEAIAADWNQ